MSDSNTNDYNNLISKNLITEEAQKAYLERLEKLEKELERLEESANKRETKNNESFFNLPKGLVFMIDGFTITT